MSYGTESFGVLPSSEGGSSTVTLNGTITAQNAAISGAVDRVITLSGSVQSQSSGVTGLINRIISFQGTLQAQNAQMSGVISEQEASASIPGKRTIRVSGSHRIINKNASNRTMIVD